MGRKVRLIQLLAENSIFVGLKWESGTLGGPSLDKRTSLRSNGTLQVMLLFVCKTPLAIFWYPRLRLRQSSRSDAVKAGVVRPNHIAAGGIARTYLSPGIIKTARRRSLQH